MRRILVLEDETSIRGFVVINLKRAGYDVIEAGTGEEALLRLAENPDVSVALLDIMLPDMDGFEVCRTHKGKNPSIGIIMLTPPRRRLTGQGLMTGADDLCHQSLLSTE